MNKNGLKVIKRIYMSKDKRMSASLFTSRSVNETHENQQQLEIKIIGIYNEKNVYITKEIIQKILKKGGIKKKIQNIELWQQAFVHESYCHKTDFVRMEKFYGRMDDVPPSDENIILLQDKSMERLEWLGDGILQSVMANYLFKRYENEDEGFLTKLRSKLVKTDTLAKLSKILGLEKYIMMSKHLEEIGNGRNDDKIVEDVFESFLGAMSLEFGEEDEVEGYKLCREFILKVFEDNIDFAALIMKDDNYKDQLMRYFHQIYDHFFPNYELKETETLLNERGKEMKKFHVIVRNIEGEIIGEGVSFNKKDAEMKAARAALNFFGIMDGF